MSTAWTGCCKGRGRKGGDLAGPRGPRTGSEPDPSSASRGIEEPGGTPRLTVETPLVNGGERAEGAGLDPVGDADLGDLEPPAQRSDADRNLRHVAPHSGTGQWRYRGTLAGILKSRIPSAAVTILSVSRRHHDRHLPRGGCVLAVMCPMAARRWIKSERSSSQISEALSVSPWKSQRASIDSGCYESRSGTFDDIKCIVNPSDIVPPQRPASFNVGPKRSHL